MKKIEAIIRPKVLRSVVRALTSRAVEDFSVREVLGAGHAPALLVPYRGVIQKIDLHPMLLLEVVVSDVQAPPVAETIARAAHTGRVNKPLRVDMDRTHRRHHLHRRRAARCCRGAGWD